MAEVSNTVQKAREIANDRDAVAVLADAIRAVEMSPFPLQEMQVGGEYIPGSPRAFYQPVWDTEEFAAAGGAQTREFFVSNVYQTVAGNPVKTDQDKNVPEEGKLPAPKTFVALGLKLSLLANLAGNRPGIVQMENFRATAVLTLKQGRNRMWRMPAEKIGGDGFVLGANPGAAAPLVGPYLNLCGPGPMDFHPLGWEWGIDSGFGFSVIIDTNALFRPTVDLRVRVKLIGILTTGLG